jgi:uncharacterized membrane protein
MTYGRAGDPGVARRDEWFGLPTFVGAVHRTEKTQHHRAHHVAAGSIGARFTNAPNESAMNSTAMPARFWAIHPFHAAVLGGVWPLFLGTLLSDYAYWSSHQIQWANFAAWLLIGAMVLTTIALLCAIVGFVRGSRNVIYVIALGAAWIVGFFDALHHARDAWAIMPAALAFSLIATAFALVATWSGLSSLRVGGAR